MKQPKPSMKLGQRSLCDSPIPTLMTDSVPDFLEDSIINSTYIVRAMFTPLPHQGISNPPELKEIIRGKGTLWNEGLYVK